MACITEGASKVSSEIIIFTWTLSWVPSILIATRVHTKSGSDYSPKFDQSLGNIAAVISLQKISYTGKIFIKPFLDFICGLLKMCGPLGASLLELKWGLI